MKVDNDSYVIWRNLMAYLRRYDANDASYHGYTWVGTMAHLPRGYNSGGAAYALSRGSARRVVEEGITTFPKNCKMSVPSEFEDVDMGDCLQAVGVFPAESRDSQRRLSFDPGYPLAYLRGVLGEGDKGNLTPGTRSRISGAYWGRVIKGERGC